MADITLSTWNVNSLRVRLPQVLQYLNEYDVDILCLQELKLQDGEFPAQAFREIGFEPYFFGQRTYNGVATLIRSSTGLNLDDIIKNNPLYPDEQKRLLTGTFECDGIQVRLINGYFPNGQEPGSEKFAYKLAWLDSFEQFVSDQLEQYENVVVVGDYNIAPEDRDASKPEDWADTVLCVPESRERFKKLTDLGLKDAFRLFEQPENTYSWWDYRLNAFRRNYGVRIDHILVSEDMVPYVQAVTIDKDVRKNERPSDHAPVRMKLVL